MQDVKRAENIWVEGDSDLFSALSYSEWSVFFTVATPELTDFCEWFGKSPGTEYMKYEACSKEAGIGSSLVLCSFCQPPHKSNYFLFPAAEESEMHLGTWSRRKIAQWL